jgi:hypothetical protein
MYCFRQRDRFNIALGSIGVGLLLRGVTNMNLKRLTGICAAVARLTCNALGFVVSSLRRHVNKLIVFNDVSRQVVSIDTTRVEADGLFAASRLG